MIMHNDWDQLFDQEIQKDYLLNLRYFLAKEYKTKNIYPAKENIFAAFKTTSLKDTKVVILGQDPYHGPGQAQGYSFSSSLYMFCKDGGKGKLLGTLNE